MYLQNKSVQNNETFNIVVDFPVSQKVTAQIFWFYNETMQQMWQVTNTDNKGKSASNLLFPQHQHSTQSFLF